jgi:hypothetical protein
VYSMKRLTRSLDEIAGTSSRSRNDRFSGMEMDTQNLPCSLTNTRLQILIWANKWTARYLVGLLFVQENFRFFQDVFTGLLHQAGF